MKKLPFLPPLRASSQPLCDSHIHLDSQEYAEDWREVYAQAREAGVEQMVLPATDLASSRRIAAMSQEYPYLYAAAGIHPHQAASYDATATPRGLREQLDGCVAIGETGLEGFYDFCPLDVQLASLRFHLRLARERELPLILHCRESEELLYQELRDFGPFPTGGVVHCFTGSWDWAQRFLDTGFHLGVNGLVTLPKAEAVHEVARRTPLDRLLLETDGPYLTPQPYRGRRNEPCLIPLIARKVSDLREVSLDEVAAATTKNVTRLFRLA